jgi:hypothetical protein
MKVTKFALAVPLAILLCTGNGQAKDHKKDKVSHDSGKSTEKDLKRSTEGHRPQDLNGDGVISRNEWPGNDVSFRELDTDRDGVLTKRDRGYSAQGDDSQMHNRPVNDNPKSKKK